MANLANINNNLITDSGIASSSYVSGTSGTNGENGISGNTGTAGTSGSSGVSTISGSSGTAGLSRTSGTNGGIGSSGTSGSSGVHGVSGISGSSGTSGSSGNTSNSGTNGSSGTSGVNTLTVDGGFVYYTSSNTFAQSNWVRDINIDPNSIIIGGVPSDATFPLTLAAYVNGSIRLNGEFRATSAYNFSISTFRNIWIDSDGDLGYAPSIAESKINISPLEDILWLDELRPVSFNYKKRDENDNIIEGESEEEITYGFIAEEVDLVNPELVYRVNGEIASIHHKQLIIPLLAKIQDLEKRIQLLKQKKGLI